MLLNQNNKGACISLSPIQHILATHVFKNEKNQDPIEVLPREVIMEILSYLQPQELERCCQVSREWQVLASDDNLWKAMYPAIAFGQKQWETYFGDVGEEPPLPSNIHQILKSPCPFWPGKKVQATHLLVLVPTTVNGKPLTLKSVAELMKSPKQGSKTQYSYFDPGDYIDLPASASHWVLMTRNVLPSSCGKSYADQQALVASYAQKAQAPYQVPNVLDATVSIFIEYVRSKTRLYNAWVYTRCHEKYDADADWQLAVGGFEAGGLHVCPDYAYDFSNHGVGSLRIVSCKLKRNCDLK